MFPRAIALVPGETVRGKFRVDPRHEAIPCHLRNHARGGDGKRKAVTFHHRLVRNRQAFHRQPIHQRDIGYFGKSTDRERHGLVGGAEDIDLINFPRRYQRDRPYDIGIPGNLIVKDLPAPLRQLLGIVEKRG